MSGEPFFLVNSVSRRVHLGGARFLQFTSSERYQSGDRVVGVRVRFAAWRDEQARTYGWAAPWERGRRLVIDTLVSEYRAAMCVGGQAIAEDTCLRALLDSLAPAKMSWRANRIRAGALMPDRSAQQITYRLRNLRTVMPGHRVVGCRAGSGRRGRGGGACMCSRTRVGWGGGRGAGAGRATRRLYQINDNWFRAARPMRIAE